MWEKLSKDPEVSNNEVLSKPQNWIVLENAWFSKDLWSLMLGAPISNIIKFIKINKWVIAYIHEYIKYI